jgi:hypothetical protein
MTSINIPSPDRANIMSRKFLFLFILSIVAGSAIGWIDSRPTWDDTGVTVGLIIVPTAIMGGLMPEHAWLWGLVTGGIVSAMNIILGANYGSLMAVAFAISGAYLGLLFTRITRYVNEKQR